VRREIEVIYEEYEALRGLESALIPALGRHVGV
jgi:hypothetical protein